MSNKSEILVDDMVNNIDQSIPIYIQFSKSDIQPQEEMWSIDDFANCSFYVGYSRAVSGEEHPRTTHYFALPIKSDKGDVEVAQFDGKVTKITTNEAPFVYEKCNSCGGTPPMAQGHDSAVSCPHCSQTIVGKQMTNKLVGQEVLLLKPEFDPIEPYYHNVDKQDVLDKQGEIEAENNRHGIGCASWMALLTTLTGGTILAQKALTNVVSKLSDINYVYNNTDYYIPTDLLKEGISTANLICLAPLILAGLATMVRYGLSLKDSVHDEVVLEALRDLPDEINNVHIYKLSNEQYADPTVMVHIREK